MAPVTNLIWSLAAAKNTTTITTSGNSGAFANGKSAVDLRGYTDFGLYVTAPAGSGTAATIQLDAFDGQGDVYAQLVKVTIASAPGSGNASGGVRGTSTAYFVAPDFGRVSWALTGTMTGVEIFLYGR